MRLLSIDGPRRPLLPSSLLRILSTGRAGVAPAALEPGLHPPDQEADECQHDKEDNDNEKDDEVALHLVGVSEVSSFCRSGLRWVLVEWGLMSLFGYGDQDISASRCRRALT